MGNFISMIGNFLTSIVDLAINLIKGIMQMIGMVPVATGFFTNTLAYIPAVVATVITAVVAINVVYLIIGR